MQLCVFALFFTILCSSCSYDSASSPSTASPSGHAPGPPVSSRLYDEALATLRTRFPDALLVIDSEALDDYLRGEGRWSGLERSFQGEALEAARALLDSSTRAPIHDDLVGIATPHVVLVASEKSDLYKEPGTGAHRLRKRYPSAIGLTTLSRIGFSSSRRVAAVYVGLNTGTMGGYGTFYVFDSSPGDWQLVQVVSGWVA